MLTKNERQWWNARRINPDVWLDRFKNAKFLPAKGLDYDDLRHGILFCGKNDILATFLKDESFDECLKAPAICVDGRWNLDGLLTSLIKWTIDHNGHAVVVPLNAIMSWMIINDNDRIMSVHDTLCVTNWHKICYNILKQHCSDKQLMDFSQKLEQLICDKLTERWSSDGYKFELKDYRKSELADVFDNQIESPSSDIIISW